MQAIYMYVFVKDWVIAYNKFNESYLLMVRQVAREMKPKFKAYLI